MAPTRVPDFTRESSKQMSSGMSMSVLPSEFLRATATAPFPLNDGRRAMS